MDNTVNPEIEADESNTVAPEEAIEEKHSEVTIITGDDFPENIEVNESKSHICTQNDYSFFRWIDCQKDLPMLHHISVLKKIP